MQAADPTPKSSDIPAGSIDVKPRTSLVPQDQLVRFYFPRSMDMPSQKLGDAAFDLPTAESYVLKHGPNIIDTKLSIHFPPGVKGHLKMRSGLSFKRDIWISLQGGVLDNGYRGNVHIMVFVHRIAVNGVEVPEIPISVGERLFQIEPEAMPGYVVPGPLALEYCVGAAPTDTARGTAGFHSTGQA